MSRWSGGSTIVLALAVLSWGCARDETRHGLPPTPGVMARITGATDVRVFQLDGARGVITDPTQIDSTGTLSGYVITGESPAPAGAWRDSLVALLGRRETYRATAEGKRCTFAPAVGIRFVMDRETTTILLDPACRRIDVWSNQQWISTGDFDRDAGPMLALVRAALPNGATVDSIAPPR